MLCCHAETFSSARGWANLVFRGDLVARFSFGHRSRDAATRWLASWAHDHSFGIENGPSRAGPGSLAERLEAYFSGDLDDFRDVQIDLSGLTQFRRRVVRQCRKIPYGQTLTYAQLATRAGSPHAARAVGNVMAGNNVPIIVPCHRVVGSNNGLGGFSAEGGVQTKQSLLDMEAATREAAPEHQFALH